MKQIDRLRKMNAEELARFISTIANCNNQPCCICPLFISPTKVCNGAKGKTKAWLESEVEE